MRPISFSLVRQLYLGKMRRWTITWHYIDLLCASGGCRMNHPHSLWNLLWYSTENKTSRLKAKVSPMTYIPQQHAFISTVLPASAFAKSHQVLRNVSSSEILSWGVEGEEEENLTQSYDFWSQDFYLRLLMLTTDTQCRQTLDKSILTESPGVQLWKATKCSNIPCSYSSLWTDIHAVPPKEKHWSYHSEEDPCVLRPTYAASRIPILVELIFVICALLPLQ